MLSQTQVRRNSLLSRHETDRYLRYRRYDEAKSSYRKVLEIHPLHPTGLAFLGMTCHLLDEIDDAILHYHEVRALPASLRHKDADSRSRCAGAQRGPDQPPRARATEPGARGERGPRARAPEALSRERTGVGRAGDEAEGQGGAGARGASRAGAGCGDEHWVMIRLGCDETMPCIPLVGASLRCAFERTSHSLPCSIRHLSCLRRCGGPGVVVIAIRVFGAFLPCNLRKMRAYRGPWRRSNNLGG